MVEAVVAAAVIPVDHDYSYHSSGGSSGRTSRDRAVTATIVMDTPAETRKEVDTTDHEGEMRTANTAVGTIIERPEPQGDRTTRTKASKETSTGTKTGAVGTETGTGTGIGTETGTGTGTETETETETERRRQGLARDRDSGRNTRSDRKKDNKHHDKSHADNPNACKHPNYGGSTRKMSYSSKSFSHKRHRSARN